MSARDPLAGRNVIFEFIALGDHVRVAAVDVRTGQEVVISGPVNASRGDLERVAGRKLARRLGLLEGQDKKKPRRSRRGLIV